MKTARARRETAESNHEPEPVACKGCPIASGSSPRRPTSAKSGDPRCRGCPAACCRTCVYAGKVRDGHRVLLVCVNHPLALGKMRRVQPEGACRNFRARAKRSGRKPALKSEGDDVRYLALTQGRFAIVDAKDYEWLSRYKWSACRCGRKWYASRNERGKHIWMHREIMEPPAERIIDHIDGNGMNNCRCNMRICTMLENGHNSRPHGATSKFKGVSYFDELRKWHAAVCIRKKVVPIGYFKRQIDAARAYDREARRRFGPYAWLNFREEVPQEDK